MPRTPQPNGRHHGSLHSRHRLAGNRLRQEHDPARHQGWPHLRSPRRPRAMADRAGPTFHVFPTLANPDATPRIGPMKRDATTDTLVAELRAVIADLRRGQDDLRQERDHWRAAHEREQAAHAATQRLLLPKPATAAERDAPATREGAPAPETPLKFWCW